MVISSLLTLRIIVLLYYQFSMEVYFVTLELVHPHAIHKLLLCLIRVIVGEIGERRSDEGSFMFPSECCISDDGRLYVVDQNRLSCIRYHDGKHIRTINIAPRIMPQMDSSVYAKGSDALFVPIIREMWVEQHGMMVVLHAGGLLLFG
jgi:hypothetical protein